MTSVDSTPSSYTRRVESSFWRPPARGCVPGDHGPPLRPGAGRRCLLLAALVVGVPAAADGAGAVMRVSFDAIARLF